MTCPVSLRLAAYSWLFCRISNNHLSLRRLTVVRSAQVSGLNVSEEPISIPLSVYLSVWTISRIVSRNVPKSGIKKCSKEWYQEVLLNSMLLWWHHCIYVYISMTLNVSSIYPEVEISAPIRIFGAGDLPSFSAIMGPFDSTDGPAIPPYKLGLYVKKDRLRSI